MSMNKGKCPLNNNSRGFALSLALGFIHVGSITQTSLYSFMSP